jgi:hypothetical protein
MLPRLLVAIALAVSGLVWAQDAPERDVSGRRQVYLRWDGLDAHREAFDKTALGKMMQGDTGAFLSALIPFLEKQLDGFDDQLSPDVITLLKELPQTLQAIGKHGFGLGVEIKQFRPLRVETTIIFPNSGGTDGRVLSFLKRVLRVANLEVKQVNAGTGEYAQADPIKIQWWTRGHDTTVLISVGMDTPPAGGVTPLVTETDLHKKRKDFREFSAWVHGYVDVAGVAKLATRVEMKRLIDDLGLDRLKSITFHSGPDGPGEHCVVKLDMPGPRKGLLRVLGSESISLTDLPPLPADMNSFAAINLDPAAFYDAAVKGIESAVRAFKPRRKDAVHQGIKLVETIFGLSLENDVFAALDKRVACYNSPGDGPFSFGTVYLVKVKDTRKLQHALDKIVRGVAAVPLIKVAVKKTTYHGATINEIRLGEESYRELPSFAIHKGWLVYSSNPQPIRGFILRANGELPTWKIDADLTRRLSAFPKDYVGIAVSDPRPAVKTLLSLGPTVAGMLNNLTARFGPQARFDLSLLPNAHEATRHLFPNITMISDDGRRVRMETRASLLLPF